MAGDDLVTHKSLVDYSEIITRYIAFAMSPMGELLPFVPFDSMIFVLFSYIQVEITKQVHMRIDIQTHSSKQIQTYAQVYPGATKCTSCV